MFQFLRRVTGSFLPRPDRPWRDDATSHAPTIGRKRTYSAANHDDDDSASTAKRTKNDLARPDIESDSASESPKADLTVERQDVKEVTKGVNEVDLEDKDKAEDASPIRPDCVPLPDSPSGSPEPESNSPEPVEEAEDQERADDEDSLASSAPEDNMEEGHEDSGTSEAVPVTINIDSTSTDETIPVSEIAVTVVLGESDSHDALEVKT